MKVCSYILYFLLLIPFGSFSAVFEIQNNTDVHDISRNMAYIEDPSCDLEFKKITLRNDFTGNSGLLNMNVSKSCFWIKVELKNETADENFQLVLEHPILDLVEFYDEDGLRERISESSSFLDRPYHDVNFTFDVFIPKGETKEYYFKISGSELIVIPVTLGIPDKMRSLSALKEMLFGIYAGIIAVMFLYNLFVYFSVRDKSYLFYVLYILFIGLTQISLKGYTTKYLWPESYILNHYSVTIVSCLAGIFALEFMKIFLHTREFAPKWHKYVYVINSVFVLSILICLYGEAQLSFTLMQIATTIGSLYAFAVALKVWRTGFRPAKFFLLAWSILLIGAITFVLKDFEVVPYNLYTNYSLQVASILEVMLLSFALADRINIFRKEKEVSQLEALTALKENERIIREQNIILEAKVEERTDELKKANSDLNVALDELKNAQSQLVSAEKMASLGQLTAGIAHEINNPINYVKSSVKPLKDNLKDILSLISEYESNLRILNDEKANENLEKFKQKIEFDYLIQETKEVIENIEEGANRTVEIVSGLRTFSHVDDLGLKLTNINNGIKSTLNLLSGEIPYDLDIRFDFGDIPEVECFGGKINQVFMNVLNNAIQAIKLKGEGKGLINIKTQSNGEFVQIIIEDNGTGMSEEVKNKMFDPFFTTKDVGEGTGLGLSVVYGIIESHHGSTEVHSELGKGTTFIINLPYIQPK